MTDETTETTTEQTEVEGVDTTGIAMQSEEQPAIDDGLNELRHENGKIFGKFTTAKDGLIAYKELQKEFTKARQENKPAPEKYTFELDEDIKDRFSLDENNPDFQRYIPLLKELNISQEKANKLVNAYARNIIAQEENVDFEAEMDKIGGVNGPVVQGLVTFAKKNFTPEQVDFLSSKIRTAEDAQFFDALIKKARGANVSIPEFVDPTGTGEVKTARDYADEAFNYQKEHARTIGYDKEQQDHYMWLMQMAASKK